MISYQYDAANHLVDVNGVAYTWDMNGNLLSDGLKTYIYDSANRLIEVDDGNGGGAEYTYNGLGDRLTETAPPHPDSPLRETTYYTLDLNTGLTQVLSDGTTTYTYGLGRISQQSGTMPEYFLGDALGSVRQMTDQAGVITFAQSYDPYGVVTSTAGMSHTEFGFTGEQDDVFLQDNSPCLAKLSKIGWITVRFKAVILRFFRNTRRLVMGNG